MLSRDEPVEKTNILKEMMEEAVSEWVKELETENQSVTITDILVRQDGKLCRGEFDPEAVTYSGDRLQRLKDQIDLYISVAELYHRQKHFTSDEGDEKSEAKPVHENQVTRLLTHEFSFYTNKTPLSPSELDALVDYIESKTKKLSTNIVFLLSSFPAFTDKDEIVNMVLHVSCGQQSKVVPILKCRISDRDVLYEGYKEFSTKLEAGFTKQVVKLKDSVLVAYCSGLVFSQTEGKAKFFSFYDICLEHKRRKTKLSIIDYLQFEKDNPSEFLPDHAAQVITSNACSFQNDCILTTAVRIDPDRNYSFNGLCPVGFHEGFRKDWHAPFPQENYPKMNFSYTMDNKLVVKHPPFGPRVTIAPYQSFDVAPLRGAYAWRVHNHNERVMMHRGLKLFNQPIPTELLPYKTNKLLVDWTVDVLAKLLKTISEQKSDRRVFPTTAHADEEEKFVKKYEALIQKISLDIKTFENEFTTMIYNFNKEAKKLPASRFLMNAIEKIQEKIKKYGLVMETKPTLNHS